MSAILGTQEEEDFIQVGTVKFPLPKAPENQNFPGMDWGSMHLAPLEPFSPTTVAGDDSLISDDRVAQQVWSDMRAGIGLQEYTETQSLSGCQDSDLDISQPGIIVLPPRKVPIGGSGALSAAWAAHAPVYGIRLDDGSVYQWLLWNTTDSSLQIYNSSTDAWSALAVTGTVTALCAYGGVYVVATTTSIYTINTAATITARWAVGCRGLCVHDNKLYTQRISDGKIYWTNPTELLAGTAWSGVSAEAFAAEPGEVVVQLLEWKDATDARAVVLLTDRRIMFYSDQDYYVQFGPALGRSGGRPFGYVWIRDDNLYLTNYPYSDTVTVFTQQSSDDVSPNKNGGIGVNQRFSISSLGGNLRTMFAFCPNVTGKALAGRTMRASEAFGWSTLNRGKLADPENWDSAVVTPVTGGASGREQVLTVFANGTTEVQAVPDRGDLAYNLDDGDYEQGPLWLVSAETDCGLEQLAKLAAWFRINAIRTDRQFGLPGGCELHFKYEINGTGWRTFDIQYPQDTYQVGLFLIRSLVSSGNAWPLVLPLPDASQAGVPFVRLRWAVGLKSTAGTPRRVTPIVRSVALHYERAPDIYDGIQVAVDLSKERFDQLEDQMFYGLDRYALRQELEKLKGGPGQPKTFWPVTIGYGGTEKFYAAMDVRLSGNVDPSTGFGVFTLTMRDVSAPPPGVPSASTG